MRTAREIHEETLALAGAPEAEVMALKPDGQGAGAAEPWGEPDLSLLGCAEPAPPRFPVEMLGGFWADWAVAAAEAQGCPVDFVAGPLLAGAGLLVGNSRRASPWGKWKEPPVLFVACVGNPSSGKSPGQDTVREPLAYLEREWNLDFEERQRRWRTAKEEAEVRRAAWLAEVKKAVEAGLAPPVEPEAAQPPPAPELRRLVTNDPTVEAMTLLCANNPRGVMLLRDELAGWLGGMDKYGGAGGDRAFWLEAFGGRPYATDRVKYLGRPVRVEALAAPVVGGIQPDRLRKLLLDTDDDGLTARFLYLYPAEVPLVRPAAVPDDNAAADALRRLLELPTGERHGADAPVVLPFSDEAADLLHGWRGRTRAAEATASGHFLSWLGKLPGLAVRLALVVEHLRWCGDRPGDPAPDEVTAEVAAAAVAFLRDYALPMAARVFGDGALTEAERDAARLARQIVDTRPATVNARGLRHAAALRTKDPARYDAALAELAAAGWVCPAPSRQGGNPGRRRKDWAVNPAVLSPIGEADPLGPVAPKPDIGPSGPNGSGEAIGASPQAEVPDARSPVA